MVIEDVNEFLRRGFQIYLLTFKPEKVDRTLSFESKLDQSRWFRNDFGSLLNLKSWFTVMRQVRSIGPDVIMTHLWYANFIIRIVGKLLGVSKIIAFEQNVYDTLKSPKMFFADRVLQFFTTRIVAVSDAVKESLLKHGIKREKIVVLHNAVDVSRYTKGRSNLKEELGIVNQFTFLFIGRLIYQKGIDILLKAFSNTRDSVLLIVGEGKEGENLKKMTSDLGLKDRVKFLGIRNDVPNLLSGADCFVLVSRYEGLPLVLAEAIAARKVIILSDFAAAGEIIENRKNGIIVPIEDHQSLTVAMNEVSEDLKLRESLISEVTKISDKVSVERHVDIIIDLIR